MYGPLESGGPIVRPLRAAAAAAAALCEDCIRGAGAGRASGEVGVGLLYDALAAPTELSDG